MYNICVSPLLPELFQDPGADIQVGYSIRSNVGTGATSEATGDLRSVSPALAGLTDTELAAPPLAGAAEEEQHCAPPTSMEEALEEAPASVSHGFDEQEAEPEAQRKALTFSAPLPLSCFNKKQQVTQRGTSWARL